MLLLNQITLVSRSFLNIASQIALKQKNPLIPSQSFVDIFPTETNLKPRV